MSEVFILDLRRTRPLCGGLWYAPDKEYRLDWENRGSA
jgi:hypothetical protein